MPLQNMTEIQKQEINQILTKATNAADKMMAVQPPNHVQAYITVLKGYLQAVEQSYHFVYLNNKTSDWDYVSIPQDVNASMQRSKSHLRIPYADEVSPEDEQVISEIFDRILSASSRKKNELYEKCSKEEQSNEQKTSEPDVVQIGNLQDKRRELLSKLQASLTQLQTEFPEPKVTPGKGVKQRLDDPKHNMGSLIACLSQLVKTAGTTDTTEGYNVFKERCRYFLNDDVSTKKLKLNNPDSSFYAIHYALISLVRAFFRIFDVILTLGAKQTMHETPGRESFFKLPEAPLSRHVVALTKKFDDAINALDALQAPSAEPKAAGQQ